MDERQIESITKLLEIQDSGLLWDEKDQDEAYSLLLAYKMKLNS